MPLLNQEGQGVCYFKIVPVLKFMLLTKRQILSKF